MQRRVIWFFDENSHNPPFDRFHYICSDQFVWGVKQSTNLQSKEPFTDLHILIPLKIVPREMCNDWVECVSGGV